MIKIQDNGIGINKENQFGNGLKNRQKRMEAIGGSFLIANNDKGNGTIVTINLVV